MKHKKSESTPTKNRKFCVIANKQKLTFRSRAKADRFMWFNSESILIEKGRCPVRSYYCHACGGFHVTSRCSEDSDYQQLIFSLKKNFKIKMSATEKADHKLQELRELKHRSGRAVLTNEFDYAEKLFCIIESKLEEYRSLRCSDKKDVSNVELFIERGRNIIAKVTKIMELSNGELVVLDLPRDEETHMIRQVLQNRHRIFNIRNCFKQLEGQSITTEQELFEVSTDCKIYITEITGYRTAKFKADLCAKLNRLTILRRNRINDATLEDSIVA